MRHLRQPKCATLHVSQTTPRHATPRRCMNHHHTVCVYARTLKPPVGATIECDASAGEDDIECARYARVTDAGGVRPWKGLLTGTPVFRSSESGVGAGEAWEAPPPRRTTLMGDMGTWAEPRVVGGGSVRCIGAFVLPNQ